MGWRGDGPVCIHFAEFSFNGFLSYSNLMKDRMVIKIISAWYDPYHIEFVPCNNLRWLRIWFAGQTLIIIILNNNTHWFRSTGF
jgi:hypothetical protein